MGLSPKQRAELQARLRLNEFHGEKPTALQTAGLLLNDIPEGLYGGAAGPGKSSFLLSAGIQYADVPGYAALIARIRRSDLEAPGGLIQRSHKWFAGTKAQWIGSRHTWYFPTEKYEPPAQLVFGYARDQDVAHLASSEWNYVGLDQSEQFSRRQYGLIGSRIRRPSSGPLSRVPGRIRLGANPGGVGHDWHVDEFVEGADGKTRFFLPGTLDDNPHIDKVSYIANLQRFLDPVSLARLLKGDWSVREGGGWFKRHKFKFLATPPARGEVAGDVRYWDLAGTEETIKGDPDYTVGLRMQRLKDGRFYIVDVIRVRQSPRDVELTVVATARADGTGVRQVMEQEPGQSGKAQIAHFTRLLAGYAFRGDAKNVSKDTRARPFSSQVEAGNVCVPEAAPWLREYFGEVEGYPNSSVHDDQVDGSSGAFAELTGTASRSPVMFLDRASTLSR